MSSRPARGSQRRCCCVKRSMTCFGNMNRSARRRDRRRSDQSGAMGCDQHPRRLTTTQTRDELWLHRIVLHAPMQSRRGVLCRSRQRMQLQKHRSESNSRWGFDDGPIARRIRGRRRHRDGSDPRLQRQRLFRYRSGDLPSARQPKSPARRSHLNPRAASPAAALPCDSAPASSAGANL